MATAAQVAQRQAHISALANSLSHVTVEQLAQQFGVTQETIRRDLNHLESQGMLRRIHGGAVPTQQVESNAPAAPRAVDPDMSLKQSIAQAALEFLPRPNAEIFIDAGTSAEVFAGVLARNFLGQRWSVVTNSPVVAGTVSSADIPNVNVLGGTVSGHGRAMSGELTLRNLSRLKADIAFLGTNHLGSDATLATSDPALAEVKKAMIQRSKFVVILADSSKLRAAAPVTFAHFSDIDALVTDKPLPRSLAEQFLASNTKVVLA
ncbi:DeoR/GlpR family DNA-binding transcription regulator [Corynebacterium gerontici]|uniref:Lactose phosphotransferase system repressor n=1 Tax=Corynebacterium gerontici TaxID=2079234 RepID=A0A3G6J0V6_9CORY|nr:DeoR/GlpR family DNA-binding transcription regulator [Corynebacterium gerontici]AZA11597.1 Glycerol-3-phosphate regulon repressor [Corynebacterium gerontici]